MALAAHLAHMLQEGRPINSQARGVRDQKKLFRIKNKIKTLVSFLFLQKYTSMVGWTKNEPKYVFLIRQRGDQNALVRHSKASKEIYSRQNQTLMLGLDCHLEQLSRI